MKVRDMCNQHRNQKKERERELPVYGATTKRVYGCADSASYRDRERMYDVQMSQN